MRSIAQPQKHLRRFMIVAGLTILLFAAILTGTNLDAMLTEPGHHALFVISGLLLGYGFRSVK